MSQGTSQNTPWGTGAAKVRKSSLKASVPWHKWEAFLIKINKNVIPQIIKRTITKNMEFVARGVPTLTQNRSQKSSKVNGNTGSETYHENHKEKMTCETCKLIIKTIVFEDFVDCVRERTMYKKTI